MSLLQVDFETPSSGTAITTSNTSPDTLSSVTLGTGGTVAASNAASMHGSQAGLITPGAGSNCFIRLDSGNATTTRVVRFYFNMAALPTAITQLVRFDASGTMYVGITTLGELRLQSNAAIVWTSAAALSIATWYRIEWASTANTASGFQNVAYYSGDNGTAIDSFSSSTVNAGAITTFPYAQIGKVSNTGNWTSMYVDDFATQDNTTTFLGPAVQNATVALGPSRTDVLIHP